MYWIERSKNGLDFETIGSTPGFFDNQPSHAYQFTDDKPMFGRTYYRIKQTSVDTQIHFSNEADVMILANGADMVFLYTRILSWIILTVEILEDYHSLLTVQLFNVAGQLVHTYYYKATK